MTQDYQQIGQASNDLDAVADQHQGWPDDTPRPLIDEQTDDADFSFYDRRANMQALWRTVSNMAGHTEKPAAM